MEIVGGRQFLGGQHGRAVAGRRAREGQVGQHRVRHVVARRAEILALVIAAIEAQVILRRVGKGGALVHLRAEDELARAVFRVGCWFRPVVRPVEGVAVEERERLHDPGVDDTRAIRHGLRQRAAAGAGVAGLIPVALPVVAVARAGVGVLEEGIDHAVAHVARDAVVVAAGHGRRVGRIGAALDPTLGEVAALADVHRVGRADGPDRILAGDRHGAPEDEVARRLAHHRAFPEEARLDGLIVVAVTSLGAGVGIVEGSAARLCARHMHQRVVGHRRGHPRDGRARRQVSLRHRTLQGCGRNGRPG